MTESSLSLKDISIRLFKSDAIKFGNYVTGTGAVTPVYFDLRVIVSYPSLMKDLSILLSQRVQKLVAQNQQSSPQPIRTVLCGVPFTAIPIASLVSVNTDIPMIMKRKEAKNYGTRKLIEGVFNKGDTCILVDDVIMFGDSILETAKELNDAGLKCSQTVVICDRQQGAIEKVARRGIEVYALLTLTEIMDHLREANYVTQELCEMVRDYLAESQVSHNLVNSICKNGK